MVLPNAVQISLFIFLRGQAIMILLLYVDDIILTGNTPSQLASFIATLGAEFELSDLGTLSYFLGLEASFSSDGLCLSQPKYIIDLLHRHHMTDCKPCTTPVCAKTQLSLHNGDLLPDAAEYHQLVGSLQYLTFTRPDIAYAVHHVAQFMSAPHSTHFVAAKRIPRNLKGSLEFGLSFRHSSAPLRFKPFLMLIGQVALTLVAPLLVFVSSWAPTLSLGWPRNNQPFNTLLRVVTFRAAP